MIDFLASNKIFKDILICVVLFLAGLIIGKLSSLGKDRKIRKDAVQRAKSVINGQVTEQVAAFLPDFPCDPADCRFVGKPVDFVAFSGMAEKDHIDEIVFVEVKTGNSALSAREKQIKECIEKKRVRYVEYRV